MMMVVVVIFNSNEILGRHLPVKVIDPLLLCIVTTLFENVVETASERGFDWRVYHRQRTSRIQVQLLNLQVQQSHLNKYNTLTRQ